MISASEFRWRFLPSLLITCVVWWVMLTTPQDWDAYRAPLLDRLIFMIAMMVGGIGGFFSAGMAFFTFVRWNESEITTEIQTERFQMAAWTAPLGTAWLVGWSARFIEVAMARGDLLTFVVGIILAAACIPMVWGSIVGLMYGHQAKSPGAESSQGAA